jgi:glycerophosphoryl diester phosphodiesterase
LGFLWDEENKLPPTGRPIAWLIPRIDLVDRKLVEQAHAAGKKVMVWTLNRAEQMRQVAEWGVDAIISDDTDLLVRSFA